MRNRDIDEFLRRAGVRAAANQVVGIFFCAAVLALVVVGALLALARG